MKGAKPVSLSEYKTSDPANYKNKPGFDSAAVHNIVLSLEARDDIPLADNNGFRKVQSEVKQDVARTIVAFLRTALSATECDTGLLKVKDTIVNGHAYISMDQLVKSFALQANHSYDPDKSLLKELIQENGLGEKINPIIDKMHEAAEGIYKAQQHLAGIERLSCPAPL